MTAHLLQTAAWVSLVLGLSVVACAFWLLCDHLLDRFMPDDAPEDVDRLKRAATFPRRVH